MFPPTILTMRIETLRQSPRSGRIHLTLDNGREWKLPPSIVSDFGLHAGQELSEQEFAAVSAAAQEFSARSSAIHILSATSVSKRELEQRLIRKGASADNARDTVQWLDEMNLLDDRVTAAQIVASGLRKGYGEARLRQMLYEKRIPKSLWDEALADLPDMGGVIDEFLQKRFGREEPNQKEIKSAIDALARRGHRYSDISAALRRFSASIEDFENFSEE